MIHLTPEEAATLRHLHGDHLRAKDALELAVAEGRVAVLKAAQALRVFLTTLGDTHHFDPDQVHDFDRVAGTLTPRPKGDTP